jgi:predicted RecB family nuclease
MAKLDTIEGIGPALSEKFAQAGITTCEALLQAGGRRDGRTELAGKTGLSEARILKLVNCADLMRVKGVGSEYSAGIDSVPELAQRNGRNLADKMAEVNKAKKLVRSVPSAKVVEKWVAHAKTLPRAVHH